MFDAISTAAEDCDVAVVEVEGKTVAMAEAEAEAEAICFPHSVITSRRIYLYR